jgi:chromate reductase
MRVLGIAGSLRAGSYNRMLLRAAGGLLPVGTELVEWDGLRGVPPFSEDDEDIAVPAVHALRAAIASADTVLVVTPEYNGSLPGQLKNVLDWASRPFPDNVLRGKPVAVIGASPSPGGAGRAQAEARTVLARIGARVLDGEVRVARAYEQFDPAGRLVDPDLRLALQRLLGELVSAIEPREAVA